VCAFIPYLLTFIFVKNGGLLLKNIFIPGVIVLFAMLLGLNDPYWVFGILIFSISAVVLTSLFILLCCFMAGHGIRKPFRIYSTLVLDFIFASLCGMISGLFLMNILHIELFNGDLTNAPFHLLFIPAASGGIAGTIVGNIMLNKVVRKQS